MRLRGRPDVFYRNRGTGTFVDDDGDPDIVLLNQNDRPLLLENLGVEENRWIGLRLVSTRSNRSAFGARVVVYAGGLMIMREVQCGASYLSGHDPRVLAGVDSVVVHWPTGGVQTIQDPQIDRYHEIVEPE